MSIPQGNGPIEAESIIEAIPQKAEKEILSPEQKLGRKRSSGRNVPLIDIVNMQQFENSPNKFGLSSRSHVFTAKTFLKSDNCYSCQKKYVYVNDIRLIKINNTAVCCFFPHRIRFGSVNLKCRDCRISIHHSCKDLVNVACVPQSGGTPTIKGNIAAVISDYAPNESPMVPAIIVHCINEV